MPDQEYIIFCDESEVAGKYYSNFYGGVMAGSSQYHRITVILNAEKHRLNLFGEIKWSKITARYLPKYEAVIRVLFKEAGEGSARVRIMFRQNAHVPVDIAEIRRLRPGFNIGISTGAEGDPASRWHTPYLHRCFRPSAVEYREELTKRGKKNGPA